MASAPAWPEEDQMAELTVKWVACATDRVKIHEKFDDDFFWRGEIEYFFLPESTRERHYALGRVWQETVYPAKSGEVLVQGEWDSKPTMDNVIAAIDAVWIDWTEEQAAQSIRIELALSQLYALPVADGIEKLSQWRGGLRILGLGKSKLINGRYYFEDPSLLDALERAEENRDADAMAYRKVINEHKRDKLERERIDATEREEYRARIQQERESKEQREAEELDAALRAVLIGPFLAQYKEGLLSERDQRDALRAHFWGELDVNLTSYVRIVHADVCDCEYSNHDYDVDEAEELSTAGYERLCEIRHIFAGNAWTIEAREHVGTCTACGAMVTRYSALVSREIGPFMLSKEYAL
jgi:hypothetical protein